MQADVAALIRAAFADYMSGLCRLHERPLPITRAAFADYTSGLCRGHARARSRAGPASICRSVASRRKTPSLETFRKRL